MDMKGDSPDPLDIVLAWQAEGRCVAIATVTATWGSSPRPVGSQIVIDQEGNFEGSVSGGCVEGAVIRAGLAAISTGDVRLLSFGVSDAQAWEVGLACGGKIDVLVTPVPAEPATGLAAALRRVRDGLDEGMSCVLAIRDDRSDCAMLSEEQCWECSSLGSDGVIQARQALQDRTSRQWNGWFFRVFLPRPQLFIIGAVHIAQPLAAMARIAAFDVVVIDPREAFANAARFPDSRLLLGWPDEAMATVEITAQTAVVTLTHDPKLDDPALLRALRSPAFYIGCLGSRKTQSARLHRLAALGADPAQLDRLHGPVGLRIGARTPAEIAIAILGEIIQALRPSGNSGSSGHD